MVNAQRVTAQGRARLSYENCFFQITGTITISGGTGFTYTTVNHNGLLFSLSIVPVTGTTTYQYTIATSGAGIPIDSSRSVQTGTIKRIKETDVVDDKLLITITGSSDDGTFTYFCTFL